MPGSTRARLQTRAAQRSPQRPEIIYGRVAKIEPSYSREVRVPPAILALIVAAASLVRAVGLLITAVLPGATSRDGGKVSFKSLKKGPEFLVTPILVRDAEGKLAPLEIHGHMSGSALVLTDRVRAQVRWSKDQTMPPRAVRIENLTTGRMLTPRGATLWSHLGVGLLLQALLGVALIGLTLGCVFGVR